MQFNPFQGNINTIIDTLYAQESISYPNDEAASKDSLLYRLTNAPELFFICSQDDTPTNINGYICGTATNSETLDHDSMVEHQANGTVLCIHSVVVRPDKRGNGIARSMLLKYIKHIQTNVSQIQSIMLVAKSILVPFYNSCGFSLVGESSLEHGTEQWYEMKLHTKTTPLVCANAFTIPNRQFSGNPAACAWLPPRVDNKEMHPIDGTAEENELMLKIAQQMNLAETAFFRPLDDMECFPKPKPNDKCIEKFVASIEKKSFEQIIQFIDSMFVFHPTSFDNNGVNNNKGTNENSCKILAFARALQLKHETILYLWGEHYQAVQNDPTGNAHGNIRAFITGNIESVRFDEGFPLSLKKVSLDPIVLVPPSKFSLRWFTPTTEEELCGHGTMAAAIALWNAPGYTKGLNVNPTKLEFLSRSGTLVASNVNGVVELDFPLEISAPKDINNAEVELLFSIGVTVSDVLYFGSNRLLDVVIELSKEKFDSAMENLDFGKMKEYEARCIIVTRQGTSDEEYDFVSRVFSPRDDINEDPVTGSAHCCLAPYWSEKLGKKTLLALQDSSRGGVLKLDLRENNGRIKLQGSGEIVWKGELFNKF